MDALLQFLLEEVAMDGDAGTSVESLSAFIVDFYARSTSAGATTSTSAPGGPDDGAQGRVQLVDDSFVSFVWDTLLAEPDVRLGVLTPLAAAPAAGTPTPAPDDGDDPAEAGNADADDAEDTKPKPRRRGKGTKRRSSRAPQGPTHEMRILGDDDAERALGRDALQERYGDGLRILASQETARVAITGSHTRISSITPIIYTVLQHVSRGRGAGTTAVRLANSLGLEPKSVFHYIKIPYQLGLVKKFSDVDEGCRTNRIVHVRYLDRSEAWRTHIQAEPGFADADADPDARADHVKDEAGGDAGAGGPGASSSSWSGLEMTPISPAYLDSNVPLIRTRIVKALLRRPEHWIPHIELHGAIGLHAMDSVALRRLNAIVTVLAGEGVLEKVSVERRKAGGRNTTAPALRLCAKPEGAGTQAEGSGAQAQQTDKGKGRQREEEEEDADDEAYPRVGKPIERQVLDLLMDADARGLTIAEISSALHHFSPRFVEAILQRLARVAPPAHLGDYALHSMQETVGRLKQARWFSLVGYLAFRRARGFPDDKAEETYGAICGGGGGAGGAAQGGAEAQAEGEAERDEEQESRLGAFETPEGDPPAEGQYATLREHQQRIDAFAVWAATSGGAAQNDRAAAAGGGGGGAGAKKARRPPGAAAGRGKARAVEGQGAAASGDDNDAPSAAAAPAALPRKARGRPRKHPLKPGEESAYMRRKREKAEDDERERLGLPPIERPKAGRPRGKKKEEGLGEGGGEGEEGGEKGGKKARGKKGEGKGKGKGKAKAEEKEEGDKEGEAAEADATEVDAEPQAGPSDGAAALAGPSSAAAPITPEEPVVEPSAPPKRKRGRPPKTKGAELEAATPAADAAATEPAPEPSASAAAEEPEPSQEAAGDEAEAPARRKTRAQKSAALDAPSPADVPPSAPTPTAGRTTRAAALAASAPAAPASSIHKRTRASATAQDEPSPRVKGLKRPQPFVEIDVSSARKRAKTGYKAFDALRGVASSSPAPPETPQAGPSAEGGAVQAPEAGPQTRKRAAEDEEEAEAGEEGLPEPSQLQGTPAEAQADASEAGPSPSPSSSAAPVSTPALARVARKGRASTPSRLGGTPSASPIMLAATPSTASRRSKTRSRPSAVAQGNLTMLERQKDVIDYVTAQGGFVELSYTLNEDVLRFCKTRRPDARQMDRPVLRQAFESCVDRELLRKTSAVSAKGQRHDVYYLPSVPPDSPELADFLRAVAATTRTYARGPLANDIVLDEAFDVADATKEVPLASMLADPVPTDSPETVRQFFAQQPLVVGRRYGVRHGLAARARQMHKWLASWLFRHADDANLVVRRDDDGFVVAQKTLLNQMPVGVYVRLVPLPFESETLEVFLADPDNCQLSMAAAPAEIVDIIRPHQPKRKAAMWNNFETLLHLRLLAPLIPHPANKGDFEPSPRPKLATHWRFVTTAPLYALGGDRSLVDVCKLDSNDAVAEYWLALQAASKRPRQGMQRPAIEDERFPSTCDWLGQKVLRRDFMKDDRWRDTYQLAELQRSFLFRLVQHDPALATDTDSHAEDIAKWAHALLAPVDVVKAYLGTAHQKMQDEAEGRAAAAALAALPRRGRKKKVKVAPDGAEADGVDEKDDEAAARRASAATALHRKVQEAADQRERDWVGILERFRAEHNQPELHAETVDWLHRAFLDPRRQVDAKHLDAELRPLLPVSSAATVPDPAGGPAAAVAATAATTSSAPTFKSIVPITLQKKARAAKDPYAISTNLPSLGKRVAKPKPKPTSQAPAQASDSAEGKGKAQVAAAPADAADAGAAQVEDAVPAQTVDSGTQDEFLTVPVPPRPKIVPGRRLKRNFYTAEQDDLILDAMAVLRARAQRLDVRLNYRIFEDFFPGNKSATIRQRALAVLRKPGVQDYHDRLVAAFIDQYRARGAAVIDDPFPNSMVAFDLAACVRFLRENIDKPQLRLMRALPQPAIVAAQVVPLPATLEQLHAQYTVVPLESSADISRRFDKVWNKYHIASNLREDSVANVPLGEPCVPREAEPPLEWEQELVRGACKAIVATDKHRYDPAKGNALLAPFDAETTIQKVVKELESKHIMRLPKEERRGPGAGISYNEKFFHRFESTTSVSRLREAADFDKELHDAGETTFPLMPTEGDMLAFFDLLARGQIDLSVDATVLSAKALDVTDFGTRQANDDDIECAINVVPKASLSKPALPLPETLLPAALTSSEPALASALARLPADATLARTLELCISAAGPEGSQLSFLARVARDTNAHDADDDDADLARAIALLVRANLAFFAGTRTLRLVHARHVAQWALPLPLPEASAAQGWFLPALWTDVDGRCNVELWTRACAWVKGELWNRSGATCQSVVDRAVHKQILTAHEVQTILRTLLDAGKVARLEGEGEGGDGGEVDWERDHWTLEGCVWH